jgi:hypothetical protein
MSAPLENARSPPTMTMDCTLESATARSRDSSTALRSACDSAFSGGLFMVNQAMPSATLYPTSFMV